MMRKRKSICFIATVEFAVNVFLISHLKKLSLEYDLTVIVQTKNIHFLADQGVEAKVIPMEMSREIDLISDIRSLMALIDIFKKKNFDAIHSLMPKAGLLSMIAGFICRTKIRIHTFTGQVWATKTGIKRLLLKAVDSLVGALATHIIIDSPSQCAFLVSEHVVNESKTFVFHEGSIAGVEINRFQLNLDARQKVRADIGSAQSSVLFLFVGRLNRDKGVLDLAKAFINANFNQAQLLFVGPDEQGLEIEIANLEGFDPSKIKFIAYTNSPEDYLSAADVLCIPSYREGFGNVVIEAAACGIPAVASNIYGLTDAVINGETGLLHEAGNIEQILLNLQVMVKDQAKREMLGRQAKRRAVTTFNSDILTKAWHDFYQARFTEISV